MANGSNPAIISTQGERLPVRRNKDGSVMMDERGLLDLPFLVLVVLTRYVSLGSCFAGASFPFATWFVYQDAAITVLAVVIGGLILYMHRENVKRLLNGTEKKIGHPGK